MKNIVAFKIFESEEDDKTYSFEELSKESQKNAIENIRNGMYEGEYDSDSITEYVIDDDYLFEPPHVEMVEVYGEDYDKDLEGKPMIGNDRDSIYFNIKSDRSYFLHCKKALDINNKEMFLGWLGFTPYFWEHLDYFFVDEGTYTKIVFSVDDDNEVKPHLSNQLRDEMDRAESNFEYHMSTVLDSITKSVDYEYEDEGIINRIESQEILFDKEGNPEG